MKKFLTFLIFCLFVVAPFYISAQTSACDANTAGKSREQLQADLDACNQEIAQWQATLDATKQQSASYARDVAALTAKINAAQANIKAKNVAIAGLAKDIATKQGQIDVLNGRINKGHVAIADILRKTNDLDSYSLPEAILSDQNFSEFFADFDSYAATEESLANLFADLRDTRTQTEVEKAELAKQKDAQAAAKAAIEAAKKEVEAAQADKKVLLAQSQTAEKTYSQVLADRQAKAAQIRAILFPLVDAGAIPFGTALQYAQQASSATGVRPALILGILQQESNLGANVGRCVITDLSSGQTRSVTTGLLYSNGINPTRDLPVLQTLLATLGRDPLNTKVSCPVAGVGGYGGAMGPTQFIPSTWSTLQSRIASATGHATPDPWNAQDAIMATALYLQDRGAASQNYYDERNAACKYYSGRACSAARYIASYGNAVMSRASTIQTTMIDPLQNL